MRSIILHHTPSSWHAPQTTWTIWQKVGTNSLRAVREELTLMERDGLVERSYKAGSKAWRRKPTLTDYAGMRKPTITFDDLGVR